MNRRPHPYQGCALPTELQGHNLNAEWMYTEPGMPSIKKLLFGIFPADFLRPVAPNTERQAGKRDFGGSPPPGQAAGQGMAGISGDRGIVKMREPEGVRRDLTSARSQAIVFLYSGVSPHYATCRNAVFPRPAALQG